MSQAPALISRSDRRIATVALIVATAMQAGDATMINVGLPPLERSLGDSFSLGAWVMTSYLCATAVMAPLTGWLRRRYGARLLFPGGVGLFGLFAIWGMRRALPRVESLSRTPIDAIGVLVLMISIGALQLCLSRGVNRNWLQSPELLAEAAASVLGFSFFVLRARTAGFTVLR